MTIREQIAAWPDRPTDDCELSAAGQAVMLSLALEARLATATEALKNLVDRVDRNGGLGAYTGGQPFALSDARAVLDALDTANP